MLRIYVASLSDYNAGILHGVWIDCEGKSSDDIMDEVRVMLRHSRCPNVMVECPVCEGRGEVTHHNSETGDTRQCECLTCKGTGEVPSAEEWAIHDHEGFGDLIGEYTGFDSVAELAEIYDQCSDEEEWELFREWWGTLGADEMPTYDDFQEAYSGTYRTLGDWAAESHEGHFDIPEALENYIDWDAMGRDAELNGSIFTINRGGSVAVFWNH